MPNPFLTTPAYDSPFDPDFTPTLAGGRCYKFDTKDWPTETIIPAATICAWLPSYTCADDKPPIINNPILDFPWPSPPPVTTGCYPLRARTQTLSEEDLPEGLTAEVVSGEGDKCFPILDLALNTFPIVDQVLSIIVPGFGGIGGGGVMPTLPSEFGCCCDEFGGYYVGETGDLGDPPYSGFIGDCIGKEMVPGLYPVGCEDCPGSGCPDDCYPTLGGKGVSWDNQDPTCATNCNGEPTCCCSYAKSNFKSLRPVGIGIVQEEEGHEELGMPYVMDLYLSEGVGIPLEDKATSKEIKAHNLAEMGSLKNDTACGDCADGRYIPGITGSSQNPQYPGSFFPQVICGGLSVVVFAISKSAAAKYLAAINTDCYTENTSEPAVPADIGGCLTGDDGLLFFFTFENAHDTTCFTPDL